MNIRYISISGNTRSFVQRLTTYSEEQHQHNEKNPTITFKEISENSPLEVETEPFFTFVPTYLDGCLTAKQYAEQFNFPFLADYELRGTQADIERIYAILKENQ